MQFFIAVLGVAVAVGLFPSGALAQKVSFGVIAGGYFNRDFDSRVRPRPNGVPALTVLSDDGGYVVGALFEARLSRRMALELDALYKPLHYQDGARVRDGVAVSFAPNTVVTWQFPVLLKYKLSLGAVNPFVEAGPAFRSAGNLNSSDPTHFGFSAGVGMETQWGRLRIAPRVRYTRWAEDDLALDARTRSDQVELLAGFSYVPASKAYPLGRRVSLGATVSSVVSKDIRPETFGFGGGTTRISPATPSVVVGPSVEVALWRGLALEVDAIPRSFRAVSRTTLADGTPFPEQRSTSGGTWEFPVLAKVRLGKGAARPFLTAGPSFRLPKTTLPVYGGTVGAGVELSLKRVKIAPSVRYTRWGPERPLVAGVVAGSGIRRDQIRVLIGVSF